ncbi:jg13669 [Pararge aegeria aegeria]|uniref:Jg13669 protein n=1 Tax=Pararge aegeria aegeria TaxID=348720 RepID=A0A8S4SG12_9NEOP|nr:jg13669 [Pararge aegeria aegeria]
MPKMYLYSMVFRGAKQTEGSSREEAFVKDGKVKLVTMDLYGALMLKMRGYRPFLILANCLDKRILAQRQNERKEARNIANEKQLHTKQSPKESSALQVLLSGRIIINGILNEILQSSTLLEDKRDLNKSSGIDSGLYSLYKDNQGVETDARMVINKDQTNAPGRKSIDFSKSSTWKGFDIADSRKSSKSVTFTSPENTVFVKHVPSTSGRMIEPHTETEKQNLLIKSISAKVAWPQTDAKPQDSDLWLAFLIENGLPVNSDTSEVYDENQRENKIDGPDFLVDKLDSYKKIPSESFTTNLKDDYEEIHRNTPGLFYDTVTMDNPETAFYKMKTLIKHIVNSQQDFKPMINIDLTNMKNCPIIKKKLANICKQIAPQRLFY